MSLNDQIFFDHMSDEPLWRNRVSPTMQDFTEHCYKHPYIALGHHENSQIWTWFVMSQSMHYITPVSSLDQGIFAFWSLPIRNDLRDRYLYDITPLGVIQHGHSSGQRVTQWASNISLPRLHIKLSNNI